MLVAWTINASALPSARCESDAAGARSNVAAKARVSPSTVSLIEGGHLTSVSMAAFRRVTAALEIRADIALRLPHGELDRLFNAGHAALHEAIARYLEQLPGWVHAPEVSFAFYAERGVIDILAFHVPTGSLIVIELKTEFVSLEDLLDEDGHAHQARRQDRPRPWLERDIRQRLGGVC